MQEFVHFSDDHLQSATELSLRVGWAQRPEDWQLILDVSEGIALIIDKDLAGTAFCTNLNAERATINMVIVDERFRQHGFGRKLVEQAIERAGDRCIRLTATDAGLPLYEKLGFRAIGHIDQFLAATPLSLKGNGNVEYASAADLDALIELDSCAMGYNRQAVLSRLLRASKITIIRDGAGIAAYAACRQFSRGWMVGPVVARSADEAREVISPHLAEHSQSFLRVDLDRRSGLQDWLVEGGMERAGGGVVMTKGHRFTLPVSSDYAVYAVASQAFG